MFDKFTDHALDIVAKAVTKARDSRQPEVTPLHLIWATFEPSTKGMACRIIDDLKLRDRFMCLEDEVSAVTAILYDCDVPSMPPLSYDSLEVMRDANAFALAQAKYSLWGIGTQHIGYALLADAVVSKLVNITQEHWLEAMDSQSNLVSSAF